MIRSRIIGSRKSEKNALAPEFSQISAHANELLEKEKFEGYLECCLKNELDDVILPWEKRFFKLSGGVLDCFEEPELIKPVYGIHVSEIEILDGNPFQLTFTRNEHLHVFGFVTEKEQDVENWIKYINAARQLSHLSSSQSFEKKVLTPTQIQRDRSRVRKILSYPEAVKEIFQPPEPVDKPKSTFDKLTKELENDVIITCWLNFVGTLLNLRDAIIEYEKVVGKEGMIDTFPNHNEVLEKSLNVLTSYAKAKSDPSQHIEDFKEKCKELEVFSSFCANEVNGIKTVKRYGKPPNDFSSLEKLFNVPLKIIIEFSTNLKSFADNDKTRQYSGFDEASAILQDVHDSILQVKTIIDDFERTTENVYRKEFLTPAKRALLYVDSGLDYPLMLFDDYVILFDLDEDDKGKEVHTLYQKLPLGLLEVEENGKFTNFKVPALSIECKVKSQNNRAANLMRRKILDAKDLFVAQTLCVDSRIKALGKDFPHVLSSTVSGDQLLLGTEKGLYILDMKGKHKDVRQIANTPHRITHINLSSNLELLTYSQGEIQNELEVYTYPLIGLNTPSAIQRHIHPDKVNLETSIQLFSSIDDEKHHRKLLFSSEKNLIKASQDRDGPVEKKEIVGVEEKPSFMKLFKKEANIGVPSRILKFVDETNAFTPIYETTEGLIPLECLILENCHIFCFEDHGIVYNIEKKEIVSTLVWNDNAHAFSILGSNILVFTVNYIEIRTQKELWRVKQLLSTPNQTVINAAQLFTYSNNEIISIQEVSS